MDPVFFDILAKFGIGAALVWWFARRDDKNQEAALARETAAQTRCEEHEEALKKRLYEVENRQYTLFTEVLKNNSEAMTTFAGALDKFANTETDKFRALEHKDNRK